MISQSKKNNRTGIKDNRGAALITVVIILLFISILCTLVLYISSVNYRMKKADYMAKVSFYSSEIPLETMQTRLVEPASISYSYAMQLTNSKYASYANVNDVKQHFYHYFYDHLVKTLHNTYSSGIDINTNDFVKDLMSDLTGVPSTQIFTGDDGTYHSFSGDAFVNTLATANKFVGADGMAMTYIVLPRYNNDGDTCYFNDFITLELEDPATHVAYDDDHVRVIFHDIYVVTVENNTTSVIRTDVAVQLPPVDWAGGTGAAGRTEFNANEMIFYVNWQKR